jgi:CheY-like chemotaxis protein
MLAQALGQTQVHPQKGRGTALVVEDSATDRNLLHALLERLGCRCDTAADGEQGVVAALTGAYDFVFMDIRMPGMDGLAATRFIHAKMGPRSPFIVAVTGLRSERDRIAALDAGVDYIIPKPVRKGAIEALLAD